MAGLATPADIVGKTDDDLPWTPEEAALFRQVDQRVMNGNTPEYTTVEPQAQADGRKSWLRTSNIPLHDDHGKVIGVLGWLEDITERKHTEETLQDQTHFLQTLIDHLPISVFAKDAPHGRFVVWNATAERMLGLTAEQTLGKTDYDFFPPEQADFFQQKDRETLAHGLAETIPCEPIDNPVTGRRFLRTIKVPIYDTSGQPLYLLGISEDITEQLRDGEELHIFKMLAENSPDAIGIAAPDGVITYANPPLRAMFGYSDATIGMINTTLFTSEDQRERIPTILATVANEGSWSGRLTGQRKDGSTFPVQLAPFAIRDSAGQLLAIPCIIRDMTMQQRDEEERAALQQQIIEGQHAAIRELSTPLLPIANRVVALPLIGSIDTQRAHQILETLLNGVARYQATTAIVDITGIQVVDTQVANVLIQAAQAIQLLGAQAVLTGIQPQIAQTLVQLGIEFRGIITRSTLQSGIAYALNRAEVT